MNNKKIKTPEEKYEDILASGDVYEAIKFIRHEIDVVEEIYDFIKKCKNDIDFYSRIEKIIENAKTIRSKKLLIIKNNIHFYQFKRKRYYKKLIKMINS